MDVSGIVVVNKHAGVTSNDIVIKLRRLFGTRQVGHTGTLDPMATGVLPVLIGRAVKASENITAENKRYTAHLKLGITTDTEDTTGTVLSKTEHIPSDGDVLHVCSTFVGEILQTPPMYSALKVNGRKLVDLAREGIVVERQARPITIHSLHATQLEEDLYELDVCCSKGTYIRTLCADIGGALGCGGVMATLRRTMAAGYTLEEAVTIDEVQEKGEAVLRQVDTLFRQYDEYHITHPRVEFLCRNGNPFIVHEALEEGLYRVYGMDGMFLCLSRLEGGQMTSVKNFFGA